jgi:uncharacterized membrane protein YphA (DoxX/SURF4 family)
LYHYPYRLTRSYCFICADRAAPCPRIPRLAHSVIFAWLVAIGETAVGISLILGLLKNVGAGGMFLSFTYYLATGKYASRLGVESMEALLVVFCALLLVLPSAQWLSIDAVLARVGHKKGANR